MFEQVGISFLNKKKNVLIITETIANATSKPNV